MPVDNMTGCTESLDNLRKDVNIQSGGRLENPLDGKYLSHDGICCKDAMGYCEDNLRESPKDANFILAENADIENITAETEQGTKLGGSPNVYMLETQSKEEPEEKAVKRITQSASSGHNTSYAGMISENICEDTDKKQMECYLDLKTENLPSPDPKDKQILEHRNS